MGKFGRPPDELKIESGHRGGGQGESEGRRATSSRAAGTHPSEVGYSGSAWISRGLVDLVDHPVWSSAPKSSNLTRPIRRIAGMLREGLTTGARSSGATIAARRRSAETARRWWITWSDGGRRRLRRLLILPALLAPCKTRGQSGSGTCKRAGFFRTDYTAAHGDHLGCAAGETVRIARLGAVSQTRPE